MSLKVECGGTREDGQSMRPRVGRVSSSNPGCPRNGTDLGTVRAVLCQPLHQAAMAQACGLSVSYDQLDRTCVNL